MEQKQFFKKRYFDLIAMADMVWRRVLVEVKKGFTKEIMLQ